MKHIYHQLICNLLLGKSYPELDRIIDLVDFAPPRGHRKYFHDPFTAALIGYAMYGKEGALAGLLHVLLDEVDRQRLIAKHRKARNEKKKKK